MPLLHIICPSANYETGLRDKVQEAWNLLIEKPGLSEWTHTVLLSDDRNIFDVNDTYSVIAETNGPVLLIGNLQQRAIVTLLERIELRCSTLHILEPDDSVYVFEAFQSLLAAHEKGEPEISVRFVVALLLIEKFIRNDVWGGDAKAKAYMWAGLLAKGRGVDEIFKPYVIEVANRLAQAGLLKTKKSQGKTKYALNPTSNKAIYRFRETHRIDDQKLREYLFGGKGKISCRYLYEALDTREK